ncbi:MAG: hypothetical protein DMF70_10160 [Acidobacteria bacterium]|nr:MAG: hypothetical protein DMF70_10160 [Acidobacteriota bacterium]
MKLKIIHLMLIAIALSLPLWLTPGSLTVKTFGPADVSRLLAFPLLVALFLERALESRMPRRNWQRLRRMRAL